ncbi:MAG: HlyD family efflux transporter periplasmic adaptor subunit [Gammaproteobacteria bacterium]|nr:HlyD family efflux transporter periplasmic adaptor subunit [Gammaproteobacteria bacterium]MBT3860237.1 HlyD family efflux transporter periplasmic adaptor subunit [Gammaproteobacteria bacterium]MBT3987529.1 HlyD family efflux transporter periplasmic adaptor subunit [Gammaproteobacteria bacterium]MBT4255994.1 HlyD family efflux transporter periplasmic adaptor subunit [Gammaproteobacteria bacterium]MBT4581733.1 HlyD family efflux transporter periplasmic adaptor subunit [Gammaproteobacteria bact
MDKKIEKKRMPLWQMGLVSIFVVGGIWFAYRLLADASIRTYRVPAEQLIISSVQFGAFEDLIPIRGTIQPFNSVFLDAVNGGAVEEVFVEEGSFVEAGQALLQLSNTNLRLSAAQNDTNITEQLNLLNNITDGFETTRLSTQRQIIDTEYRITVLERQESRQETLVADGLVSEEQFTAITDELGYQKKVLANHLARQELEIRTRETRLLQIADQIAKLEENLEVSQSSYESLLVRAPIAGQLTSLPVEIGESKQAGQRLGQIDVIDQYKVVAQIDEFYVSRVAAGQSTRFTLSGKEHFATVLKVYPEITAGTFEVDLIFEGASPENVRRGQTLQMELTLGNPIESLLLPLGGFIQDTGGNWVFVIDESGEYAVRHDISVGRRNNRYVEVRDGLNQGDRVITSSYSQMEDMERIQLSQ